MLYHERGCVTTQSNDFRHPTEVQNFLYSKRGWCLQRANPDWIRCTDWQTPQWIKRWKVTGIHSRILLKLLPSVEPYTNFMLGRALPTVTYFQKGNVFKVFFTTVWPVSSLQYSTDTAVTQGCMNSPATVCWFVKINKENCPEYLFQYLFWAMFKFVQCTQLKPLFARYWLNTC